MNLENSLSNAPPAASSAAPKAPVIASPWLRLGAVLLDGIIMFPVGILVVFLSSRSLKLAFLLFPAYQLLYVSYQAFFHARYGATPGKMAFKMKVVNESDYSKIDLFTALKRISVEGVLQGALAILAIDMFLSMRNNFAFSNVTDFLKMFGVGPYHTVTMLEYAWEYVGIVSCLLTFKRKAVHDFIAGTVVIRETKET